jgi:hypothetical protein
LIDHILEHHDRADGYAANADRIAALRSRSKHLRDQIRRCREAADHANEFRINPLVLTEERATWQQLCQYSLERIGAVTVAGVYWLRAVVRHGRSGSRNLRRDAELLTLIQELLRGASGGSPSMPTCAGNSRETSPFWSPARQIASERD